jgi:hypothetical protein
MEGAVSSCFPHVKSTGTSTSLNTVEILTHAVPRLCTTRFYDAIGNILDTHRYGLSIGSCDSDWHTFTKTETSYKTYYK